MIYTDVIVQWIRIIKLYNQYQYIICDVCLQYWIIILVVPQTEHCLL